jgi:hypothetical protein
LFWVKSAFAMRPQNRLGLGLRHRAEVDSPEQGDAMNEMDQDPVPLMQKLLDNPFLLLFLGVMIPMVLYTLWGVIDILTIPMAR